MRLIDADALVNDIRNHSESYFADDFAREWVDRQPTVNPQRMSGKWIFYDCQDDKYDEIKCPFCHKCFTVDAHRFCDIGFVADDFKYCPNCGSNNRGEEDETD